MKPSIAPNSKSRIVLMVDDDADIRNIVGSALSAQGYTPLVAASAEEALQLVSKTEPDLAVLDVMMPGMNGNDLCKALKARELGAHLPILMLTARDGVDDKVGSLDGGADDYLTKPFNFRELMARINALLRVRDLNIKLLNSNRELQKTQSQLVEKERQLVVYQLAGTAAHKLGQPLSAILLNCHLLENLPATDARYQQALAAVKDDAKRMAEMIEQLKTADAGKKSEYFGGAAILDLEEKK